MIVILYDVSPRNIVNFCLDNQDEQTSQIYKQKWTQLNTISCFVDFGVRCLR